MSVYSAPESSGLVRVDGGRIWYRMNGSGCERTPLLIVHGGPGLSHHYLLSLVALAKHRPVVFYDQLDSGRSDHPNEPDNWRVPRFVAEVDHLRDQLHLQRLFILGNSWGGTIAAAYASSHSAGLVGVILSSPLIQTRRWVEDNQRHRDALPADVIEVLDHHEYEGSTDTVEYFDAVMVFNHRHYCRTRPWPANVVASMEGVNDHCYQTMWGPNEFTCIGTLMDYDGRPGLRKIKCPVLFTCGEFDEATPGACQTFASLTENASCRVFSNASHLAFVEQPADYLRCVEDFMRNHEETS